MQIEKFILKLNSHAIEFIKSSKGDPAKHDMAKDLLTKAE